MTEVRHTKWHQAGSARARCYDCGERYATTSLSVVTRWAKRHVAATGHRVERGRCQWSLTEVSS